MNITCNNIHAHEFIGLDLRVIDSKDPTLINLQGKVLYETKNLLFIKTNNMIKKIPKGIVILEFNINGKSCIIQGNSIIGRPEDRIRRL